jgi:hypothetical protein
MTSDLRAAIEAAVDLSERPKPGIAELSPVTKALGELRAKVTSDIRAHAGALGVRVRGGEVVQEIQETHEASAMALLARHQRSELDLFLDTDGTDAGVQFILHDRLDREAIEVGSASIDGIAGTIVARPGALSAFEQSFRTDRGYSDLEAASINHETTPAVDEALSMGADPVAQADADRSAAPRKKPRKPRGDERRSKIKAAVHALWVTAEGHLDLPLKSRTTLCRRVEHYLGWKDEVCSQRTLGRAIEELKTKLPEGDDAA